MVIYCNLTKYDSTPYMYICIYGNVWFQLLQKDNEMALHILRRQLPDNFGCVKQVVRWIYDTLKYLWVALHPPPYLKNRPYNWRHASSWQSQRGSCCNYCSGWPLPRWSWRMTTFLPYLHWGNSMYETDAFSMAYPCKFMNMACSYEFIFWYMVYHSRYWNMVM